MVSLKRSAGIIALSDVLRPEAADMVKRLNNMGTKSVPGILTPTTGALVHNAGSCFAQKNQCDRI